jgi:hypothetical protein
MVAHRPPAACTPHGTPTAPLHHPPPLHPSPCRAACHVDRRHRASRGHQPLPGAHCDGAGEPRRFAPPPHPPTTHPPTPPTAQRLREVVHDYRTTLRKAAAAVAARKNHAALFGGAAGREGGGAGGGPDAAATDSLLRERSSLAASHRAIDDIIAQAAHARETLQHQRTSIAASISGLAGIAATMPGVTGLIDAVRSRRLYNNRVVGAVIGLCICFTLWYLLRAR